MAALNRVVFPNLIKHHKFLKSYAGFSNSVKPEKKTPEIVVPFRIERGPTEILEALAATVSKDHSAPHYKYEDDPYFIPSSNISKRAYALSKESGKKAARHFLETYPELFKSNTSVPLVQSFEPPVTYTEENVSTVEPLQNCIKNDDVTNATFVYEILKKKGLSVPHDVKLDLLELLCFYNSSQPPMKVYYEDRYYQKTNQPTDKWNLKGSAEKLFEEMEKDDRAYSAVIAGNAKFLNPDRALLLFEEMKGKNLKASVHAYNGLISVIHLLKEDNISRWEFAMFLLSQMNAEGARPNLHTFNNLLNLLCKCSRWSKAEAMALKVLSEMKKLKIDPSLGTYKYIMLLFCAFDFSRASILHEIMIHIEHKEFTIKHPSDVFFFATAMELCWKGLNDKEMAYRLHRLLEHGKNSKLIGNSLSTSQYLKSFFMVLCETEDVDKFMQIYEKYVPNMYIPEPSVTYAVVQAIHFNGMYKYLPRLCSDILFFEQTERANILDTLLESTGCMKHEEKLQADIINMVWNIMLKFKARSEGQRTRLPFEWTGVMLGNVLKTFMNGNDVEKSWFIIQKFREQESHIIGYPEKDTLLKFCELCFVTENYDKIKYCIKYAVNSSFPNFKEDAQELSNKMFENNELDSNQRSQVNSLFEDSAAFEDDSPSSSSSSSDGESSSDSSSDDEKEQPNNELEKQ